MLGGVGEGVLDHIDDELFDHQLDAVRHRGRDAFFIQELRQRETEPTDLGELVRDGHAQDGHRSRPPAARQSKGFLQRGGEGDDFVHSHGS